MLRDESAMAGNEIHVDADIGRQALIPLKRMLDFKA
jgi:quinolinate synthase